VLEDLHSAGSAKHQDHDIIRAASDNVGEGQ
jgi:hypothetical protein